MGIGILAYECALPGADERLGEGRPNAGMRHHKICRTPILWLTDTHRTAKFLGAPVIDKLLSFALPIRTSDTHFRNI